MGMGSMPPCGDAHRHVHVHVHPDGGMSPVVGRVVGQAPGRQRTQTQT